MAICDAQYCFTIVDIGNFGRDNDAQIFNSSEMGKAFISGNMSVPSQTVVEGFTLPHVLVSDEIFGVKTWLMKPYPGKDLDEEQRIFNYRLSWAALAWNSLPEDFKTNGNTKAFKVKINLDKSVINNISFDKDSCMINNKDDYFYYY